MIVELISKYLETHKRLVIPNLGTFIVKEPGRSVLFSNLIKNDDGVLRSLLAGSGVSELEAAGAVDRFVFEVRYRLQNDGVCRLKGFGELRSGANETVTFAFSPATEGEELDAMQTRVRAEAAVERPAAGVSRPSAPAAAATAVPETAAVRAEEPVPTEEPARGVPEGREDDAAAEGVRRNRSERMKALYEEPHMTVSPKMRPADYVKGLRYGKGRKVVTGREYTARPRRKGDKIMLVAIIAAVLAVLALAYGYYCDLRSARMDEEIYGRPQSGAEPSVRNPDLDYMEEPQE